MESERRKQFLQQLRVFLQKKMQSPDAGGEIIVRVHEVGAVGRVVGIDEEEAWRTFKALKGTAWEGRYMPESRSEERGYTAARITWAS